MSKLSDNLVKKADYNTKINEIETTDHNHEFTKILIDLKIDLKWKWENLASQSDIANFLNKTDFDNQVKNVTSNKNELNEI